MGYSALTTADCYLIRLKLPYGSLWEVSGCDCDALDAAADACRAVARWLHTGVLDATAVPADGLRDVFELREELTAGGDEPLAVTVQAVRVRGPERTVVYEESRWGELPDTDLESDVPLYTTDEGDEIA